MSDYLGPFPLFRFVFPYPALLAALSLGRVSFLFPALLAEVILIFVVIVVEMLIFFYVFFRPHFGLGRFSLPPPLAILNLPHFAFSIQLWLTHHTRKIVSNLIVA